jgi:metallo-beta-lactamase family protein
VRVLPIDPLDRVTGSCYLVHVPESNLRLLVDCGADQDGLDPEQATRAEFPFDSKHLQYVLLKHAHFAHCGRLLELAKAGFAGQVVGTEEAVEVAKRSLEDSLRRERDPALRHAVAAIRWRRLFATEWSGRPFPIAPDLFAVADRAGHILGAVSIGLISGPKEPALRDQQARVLSSGDIGNHFDHREVQPLLRRVKDPHGPVHLAFTESTYGAIVRDSAACRASSRRAALSAALREGLARRGPIILPVFAIQRAQDVLWDLHLLAAQDPVLLRDIPILVDAPMALHFNAILRRGLVRDHQSPNGTVRPAWLGRHAFTELGLDPGSPLDLERLRRAADRIYGSRPAWSAGVAVEASVGSGATLLDRFAPRWWSVESNDRARLIAASGPRIVLASGGMADFGPVQRWLAHWLGDERATALFAGHCARSTLGGKLNDLTRLSPSERERRLEPIRFLDGEASIRPCDVRAALRILSGDSAHADQARLVDWAFPKFRDGTRFAIGKRLRITDDDSSSRRGLKAALEVQAAALQLEVRLPRPGGEAIDVASGAPVERDAVLGARPAPVGGESGDRDERSSMLRRLAALEAETAALKRMAG